MGKVKPFDGIDILFRLFSLNTRLGGWFLSEDVGAFSHPDLFDVASAVFSVTAAGVSVTDGGPN